MLNQEVAIAKEKNRKEQLATRILHSVQEDLIAQFPYMSRALLTMPIQYYTEEGGYSDITVGFGSDGESLFAIPDLIIDTFEDNPNRIRRMYLHTILHCLFIHMLTYERVRIDEWDMAADVAVENIILNLGYDGVLLNRDDERQRIASELIDKAGKSNAEAIYSYLLNHREEKNAWLKYHDLFKMDLHHFWMSSDVEGKKYAGRGRVYPAKVKIKHRWKNMERSMETEIESYEKTRGYEPGTILKNFAGITYQKEDYSEFLRKFAVRREEVKLDRDQFDYVYYTYGLSLYHNMPLIEPLEYREDTRIRDLVIAIDTSGSVQGRIVTSFLEKTWSILKSEGSFFHDFNLWIIQCDAKIQEEVTIHDQDEFDAYMKDITLKGFGGTDFRPVFMRVNELIQQKAFSDLRGLLYFTDGRGQYPKTMPEYKTAFVMIDHGSRLPEVPGWAIRLVLDERQIQ